MFTVGYALLAASLMTLGALMLANRARYVYFVIGVKTWLFLLGFVALAALMFKASHRG